jgi:hypothetical protein
MEKYTPILNKVVKIKTNIPLISFQYLKFKAENSTEWNFLYGGDTIEDKHPKLEINQGLSPKLSYIRGLISSMFFDIYESGGKHYFNPELIACGISIKDKYRKDNIHTDHVDDALENYPVLKILGILNTEWEPNWGGGFIWDNITYPLKVNEFLIFDPRIPHAASDIFCNKKRLALDMTAIAKT